MKKQIKVRSSVKAGGVDVQHSRRLSALLEKEDRAIRRREKAISRALKALEGKRR